MAQIFANALQALWQVALVALVLGAGIPALFAVGIRSLNSGRTVAVGAGGGGGGGGQLEVDSSKPTAAGLTGAVICFGICIAAALFGIVVIVFGKQLFGV
jgi:hypothetical protein